MSKRIYDLTATDTLQSGDALAVYSSANGDTRKASLSTLTAYLNTALTVNQSGFTTQCSNPSATGFSVQITDGSSNIHLILAPVAGYAAGTIVLPAVANAIDKQEILVNCTQAVTTLTIDKNGATAVTGAPTTLSANDFFKLRYDDVTSTWYRVG